MDADDEEEDGKPAQGELELEAERPQMSGVAEASYQDLAVIGDSGATSNATTDNQLMTGELGESATKAAGRQQQIAAQQHHNNSTDSAQQNLNKSRHKLAKVAGCQPNGPRHYSCQPIYQHAPIYQPAPSQQSPLYLLASGPPPPPPTQAFQQTQISALAYLTGPAHRPEPGAECSFEACQLVGTCTAQAQPVVANFHHQPQQCAYFWHHPMRSQAPLYQHQAHQLYLAAPYAIAAPVWPTFVSPGPPMGYMPEPTAYHYPAAGQLYTTPVAAPTLLGFIDQSQLKFANQTIDYLLSSLPIRALPATTRQAYGMDKVWEDEFQHIFSQVSSNVTWNLAELESNPAIVDSPCIVAYRGHYLVDDTLEIGPQCSSEGSQHSDDQMTTISLREEEPDQESVSQLGRPTCVSGLLSAIQEPEQEGNHTFTLDDDKFSLVDRHQPQAEGAEASLETTDDSDCDSNTTRNRHPATSGPDSGLGSDTNSHHTGPKSSSSSASLVSCSNGADSGPKVTLTDSSFAPEAEVEQNSQLGGSQFSSSSASSVRRDFLPSTGASRVPLKFRMFIDSAKVRFSCENCGHGWTSMKGRVVFWYELFEFVNAPYCWPPVDQHPVLIGASLTAGTSASQSVNQVIGYCAYKLFGQQCDICKIEDRFERPMWYPEEVTKVLSNLYCKIGQVYFGFKTPAIDKQRRAGKPRTSHNSSLCQACHDGLCTDRK